MWSFFSFRDMNLSTMSLILNFLNSIHDFLLLLSSYYIQEVFNINVPFYNIFHCWSRINGVTKWFSYPFLLIRIDPWILPYFCLFLYCFFLIFHLHFIVYQFYVLFVVYLLLLTKCFHVIFSFMWFWGIIWPNYLNLLI